MHRATAFLLLAFGALAATGFAPLGWVPATLVGLAGGYWLVHDARTLRSALWRGWLWGVGHFTINNNWIQHAFSYQDKMPAELGYFAVVGLALYLAVYPMLGFGIAWRFASPRSAGDTQTPPGPGYALVAGAAWIVTEWLRARMFTGYAWDPLGVIWVDDFAIARTSAWIGTYALSGLTVAAAVAVLPVLRGRRWGLFVVVVAALLLLQLTAPELVTPPAAPGTPLVRVIQPNTPQEDRSAPDFAETSLRRLSELSGTPGAVPRLIVWPEGAVDHFLEEGYPVEWYWRGFPDDNRRRLAAVLGSRDMLLTGGSALIFDARGKLINAGNTVFAITPQARLAGRYDKAHLVPYGEYLPARPILGRLGLARLVPGDIDFLEGPGPRAIDVPGIGPVGMQICYEIVFSGQVVDRARRPRILFNPSNDAWFGTWGPPQHLAQARMRALEEGLPILRSTPTGISAIIDAHGRLLATVPQHQAGAIELPLPPALPPTLFARLGNWLAFLTAGLMILTAIAFRRRRS